MSKRAAISKDFLHRFQILNILRNLFLEKSEDLLLLDTHNIANTNVVNAANLIETLGNEQFSIFVNSHLKSSTKSMSEPVRKNKFPIFSQATTKITLNN